MKSLLRSLWEVYLLTTPQAEETAAALLAHSLGQSVSSVTDLRTNRVRVAGYLTRPPARGWQHIHRTFRQELDRLRTSSVLLSLGPLKTRRLPARRWAEAWKTHFRPFTVGRALLIRPSWSRRRPRREMRLIEIDPGLSFGTGQHPTTRFCLDQLLACRRQNCRQSCLDLGTGSGLLAIAAAKLGYQKVLAIDIDPVAVSTARRNARRNRVANTLRFRHGDVRTLPLQPASAYDVVCANLQTDLLLQERERIAAAVRPGGFLVLAGMLRDEMPSVLDAYQSAGFRFIRSRCQGEWRSGCFRRVEP